jgi:small-conductance mechanosensitive channel
MKTILENKVVFSFIILIALFLFLKISNFIFKKIRSKRDVGIGVTFLQSAFQAIVVIYSLYHIFVLFIGNQETAFSENLIKASPFIAVVLGFILQESLANILQGMVLIIFKPFQIGSRIRLVNSNISGIVTNINLNNTMIQNISTSAVMIIPNSVIAKEVIENFHYDESLHKYYFDIQISFYSEIDKAIALIKEVVGRYSVDARTDQEKSDGIDKVQVLVQRIDIHGVNLRCPVYSKEIADNFLACSNIRHDIVNEFRENNIRVPYSQDFKIINLKELETEHIS